MGNFELNDEEKDDLEFQQQTLKLKIQTLEIKIQTGQLTLLVYIEQVKQRFEIDRKLALLLNKQGRKNRSYACITYIKNNAGRN